MQLIAVDIGNSSTKIAFANPENHERWSYRTEFRNEHPAENDALDELTTPAFWSVSSVNTNRQNKLRQWITQNRPEDQFREIQESDVPLKSDVNRERNSVEIDWLRPGWRFNSIISRDPSLWLTLVRQRRLT